jgi:SAM-dependent methyltransferase
MAEPAARDARFRAGDHAGSEVDPFLVSVQDCLSLLPSGAAALDLACGAGRHAVWLGTRGFRVTAVDFSDEALARTTALAREQRVNVECRRVDLESPDVDLGRETWDLITGFFFLHRPLFPHLCDALRPGGLLIYKTYTTDQLRYPGRPRHPMHLLEPNELLRAFAGFRVLRYEEVWEGKGTAALAAQKGL